MKFNIETDPSKEQLKIIKEWLIQEEKESGEGFLCNWNIIEKYFNNNQLVIVLKDQQPIGFSTWRTTDDFLLTIDIVEIHPQYRFNGAGKFLFDEIITFQLKRGVKVVELICAPSSSERFWKKLGFIDLESDYDKYDLTLFKPLIETLDTKIESNATHLIELWCCEPYKSSNIPPKWSWTFNLNNGKIHPPILLSGGGDWKIRLTVNGEVLKETKVKYFSSKDSIFKNGYIYISNLK